MRKAILIAWLVATGGVAHAGTPGACCLNDGCISVDAATCDSLDGVYVGDGSLCQSSDSCHAGTCCTEVGCFWLTETECMARDDWQDWYSGSFGGLRCYWCIPPLGACCFPGVCVPDQTESDCLSVTAYWAGPLTACEACPPCEGPDFDGDGDTDNCDNDIDNDGVPNHDDVCDFTPAGLYIRPNGTVPADLDGDCNVDLHDYALWQRSLTGP